MAVEAFNTVSGGYAQSVDTEFGSQGQAQTFLLCRNSLIGIGLKHLLDGSCFAIVGVAADLASFSLRHPQAKPDLFMIDGSDSAGHLLETVRSLKDRYPEARVAVFADAFDPGVVKLGHDAGVDGFCLSASSREVVVKSLELVMLGERVLPTSLIGLLLTMTQASPEPMAQDSRAGADAEFLDLRAQRLSSREAEILQCLTEGAPNKIIARKLDVAEATVKVHVKAILRKIGAANRTQAAMWATNHLPKGAARSLRP